MMMLDSATTLTDATTMSQSLSFRTATLQDTPQLVGLLNATFRTPTARQTWEWFVYGNPYGPSRVYVAVDKQETIVGTFGFFPIQLRINGEAIAASYAHHLALKPAYRDGLSFIALSRYALRHEASLGTKLIMGPPNRHAYKPHTVLMKWTDLCSLDCLYKASPLPRPHDCQMLDSFTEEFDLFYACIAQKLSFHFHKTAQWMNWRFCDRPGTPYTIYATRDEGKMSGYVVLKRWQESNGYLKAHIIDLHALSDGALANLIAAAESYAVGCHELNLWVIQGYPYRRLIESMQFVSKDALRQPIIVRTFDGSSVPLPRGCASFSYGDGDSQY
jgi:hypothetical protein